MTASSAAWFSLSPLLLVLGCLDPEGSDHTGYSSYVLARGAHIASVESDEATVKKIDANDGIDGSLVPLHSGYAAGKQVRYWDFGPALSSVEPLYEFRRKLAHGEESVDHPDLIDSIPGDTSYSSLRALYVVYVTKAYAGQRITSLRALDDAIELGLLEDPKPLGTFTNCPVVLAATRVELGAPAAPAKPTTVYYRGRTASHFCLSDLVSSNALFALPKMGGALMLASVYTLRRQNDPVALDEAAFKTDLNADGDLLDTNSVFSAVPGDMRYTSIWREVSVIVSADYKWAQSRAESDLFDKHPWGLQSIAGLVVQSSKTDALFNRPIQALLP